MSAPEAAAGERTPESERERAARQGALDAMHEEEVLGKAYDARLVARLWPFVRPYRGQVALALGLVAPLFLVELAPAWIMRIGLDRVLSGGVGSAPRTSFDRLLEPVSGWLAGPAGVDGLVWLAGIFVAVSLAGSALQYLDAYLLSLTGQSAMRDLRRAVFDHIQGLHLGFFDRYPVGRLVTRATNDIENVAEMFSAGVVALITDLAKMVGFAVAMALVDARLALMTLLVVPVMAVLASVFRIKVRAAYRLVRVRIARINAYLQENVTGMREVQLFGREARNLREFERMNAEHRDAWRQSVRYDSALFSVVELAQNLTLAIILWQATGIATAGTIYVFVDWMRRFFMPLRDLSAKYSVMQSSMASAERIFQLLDTQPGVRDAPGAAQHPAAGVVGRPARVDFERVWFAYGGEEGPGTDWVLRDFSLRVEPGGRVALVGPTGAGKTTVLKLLTRLYEPTRGRILLDGVDLRELPQEHVRRRVAMVLQDVFLFSGTIAENVAMGRHDVLPAQIERVSRAVQAHRFIEQLPGGYAEALRERGTNLSAGQRQLVSFARALAHGADVLALDEATSSIDSETEALVQQGIHALMKGRTAIAIAHRLSTIQDVDTIHVLEGGRVVESGSHDELLAGGGLYARLHRLQVEPGAHAAAAG